MALLQQWMALSVRDSQIQFMVKPVPAPA